ncbi:MAG: nicotinate-nucleotide--dimethylbenzimidazole phosphoribosyltransferase [Pseudomonadota bacterium]
MLLPDLPNVSPVDLTDIDKIQQIIDQKTKPVGALGEVEAIARQVALIQNTRHPRADRCELLIFAGDHGASATGISAYPAEVTRQMVLNFLAGGAAANVFAAQNGVTLQVVDAGVAGDPIEHTSLITRRIGPGTRNYLDEPAMTVAQANQALTAGAELGRDIASPFVAFGDMGIGNTSSAALIAHKLLSVPLEQLVGRGTGLDDDGLMKKRRLLQQASARANVSSVFEVLCEFGGFEINMMAGAMIGAASQRRCILVDGYIATAAFIAAQAFERHVHNYAIFCHRSAESGHQIMLDHLDASPLLDLGLRLGEGTGALLAWPIVRSAVSMLNDMASFQSGGVSTRS